MFRSFDTPSLKLSPPFQGVCDTNIFAIPLCFSNKFTMNFPGLLSFAYLLHDGHRKDLPKVLLSHCLPWKNAPTSITSAPTCLLVTPKYWVSSGFSLELFHLVYMCWVPWVFQALCHGLITALTMNKRHNNALTSWTYMHFKNWTLLSP